VGALTDVTFGSADHDHFDFDPSTGRLNKYTFHVGWPAQTDVGQLTWNANGSLQKLQITDGITAAQDTQTCTYTHDDLGRIATANCGTPWSQTFSYDPFGNINKTGSLTFQPGTYPVATNRVPSSFGFTYDNNGNLTSDGITSYTWDAEGKMLSASSVLLGTSVSATYDALGRMVEQQRSTAYQQIVYGPGGGKLALMNGQTLTKAFVPLPGGATAVYNSSGLQYYRHSDHLGSSRLASTPSRTLYYSGAYAPFGESYKEAGTTDHSFTGNNEDTVAGMADFMYREYSSAQQGRWISPDPAGLKAVSLTDPQTWNRYAYVANRPMTNVDPLGMYYCDFSSIESTSQNGGGDNQSDCEGNGGTWVPEPGDPDYVDPNGGGFGLGESQVSYDDMSILMGYDIFDAIAGAPGTFLSIDSRGNMGFGFSPELYTATENVIDAAREGYRNGVNGDIGVPSAGVQAPYTTSLGIIDSNVGFQAIARDYGTSTVVSGLIPDMLNAVDEEQALFSKMSSSAQDEMNTFGIDVFIDRMSRPNHDPANVGINVDEWNAWFNRFERAVDAFGSHLQIQSINFR